MANLSPAWALRMLRLRQWSRICLRLSVQRTLAPFHDPAAILRLLSTPIFLWLVFLASGFSLVSEEALVSWAAMQALLYALPFFVVINIFTAFFSSGREIRDKGKWFEGRFVYHSPQHVFTTQVAPADDGLSLPFKVKDAEPNTFVQFKIEYDRGLAVAAIGSFIQPVHAMGASRKTAYGARIDAQRKTALSIKIPENSDTTIIRVYAISWEQ